MNEITISAVMKHFLHVSPGGWKCSFVPGHIVFVKIYRVNFIRKVSSDAELQIYFLDRWARITHGAKYGGEFSEILPVLADIDSHLFKNHLNVIRDRPEVESKVSVKTY